MVIMETSAKSAEWAGKMENQEELMLQFLWTAGRLSVGSIPSSSEELSTFVLFGPLTD